MIGQAGYDPKAWAGIHTGEAFRGKTLSQSLDLIGYYLANGFIREDEALQVLEGYLQKRRTGFYSLEGSDSILQKVGQALSFIPIPQAQVAAFGLQAAGGILGTDSGALQRDIPWTELDQMAHDVREAKWGIEYNRAQHPEGLPLSLETALMHLKDLESIIERHRGYGTDSTTIMRVAWDDINALWNAAIEAKRQVDYIIQDPAEWLSLIRPNLEAISTKLATIEETLRRWKGF